jgi:hypothetical protein
VDIADSYHIYGSDHKEFRDRFLKSVNERSFEQRTWRSDDVRVTESIKYGQVQLDAEKKQDNLKPPEKKSCQECKFFVGEMLRSIGPATGYCDNETSPYYRKNTYSETEACDDFSK